MSTSAPGAIARLREDIESVMQRDPAARSHFQVAVLYSGLHAVWWHRLGHWLWLHNRKAAARFISQLARNLTGVEIHPGATLGRRVFIDHGMGVVIGETAIVGEDVTIYQGVTLGGTNLHHGKRHPTIGARVTIGAGAKVLGDIEVGADSRIGANAVLVRTVPCDSVVVGVPGQVVTRAGEHTDKPKHDAQDSSSPDPVGATVQSLIERLSRLEQQLNGKTSETPFRSEAGVWQNSSDFEI